VPGICKGGCRLMLVSVLLQRGNGTNAAQQVSEPWNNVEIPSQFHQLLVSPAPAPNNLQTPSRQPPSDSGGYSIGAHSLVDGLQYLLFFVLSLLSFAIILIIGGFYVVCLILFPFAELPSLFKRSEQHWMRFNAFFSHLFNKIFRFAGALWD